VNLPLPHRLQEEYLKRLRGFEQVHPSAYRFLKRLEEQGPEHGLWLSTASNAHLYKGHSFLVYLQLRAEGAKPAALLLAPKFNVTILDEAVDRSSLLFPRPIERLVMAQGGFRAKWAAVKNATLELTTSAPDKFFDSLMQALIELQLPD
jgi:hypothetical protein